jgi:hypothetical protein
LRHKLRRTRGVSFHHRRQPQVGQDAADLTQGDGMRMGAPDVSQGGALDTEQAVLDALERLANNEQAGSGQQVVDVGDASRQAVLARQHP